MPVARRIYQAIEPVGIVDAEAALERNDPAELSLVAIGVGLYSDDLAWSEDFCLRLAQHPDPGVRGNAVLSFGHLSRRFKALNRPESVGAIRRGLADAHEYVRGHAYEAADTVEWFTKLKVRLPGGVT